MSPRTKGLDYFKALEKTTDKERGLTLVEVLVSMVVLVTGMLAVFPFFAAPKVTATDNELRKSEVAIAQNILDEIRQTDWDILQDLDGLQTTLPPTVVGGNGESIQNIKYGSRIYHSTIEYCPDVNSYTLTNPGLPSGPNNPYKPLADENGDALDICDDNNIKLVRIEVRRDKWGYKVDGNGNVEDGQYYTIDTIFTDLERND